MGVKLFAMVPRLPSVSEQEFHDHWRHPHLSLGNVIDTILHSVQSHRIDCDYLGPEHDQAHFEGIGEVWFDSVPAALSLAEHPQYKYKVQPDEPAFVDLPRLEWLFTEGKDLLVAQPSAAEGFGEADALWTEHERPTSIKVLQFVRADGDPGWAASDDKELGLAIGSFRHIRRHPSKEAHGDQPTYLGVRELWWPTLSAFRAGVSGNREAWNVLIGRAGQSITMLAHAERWR